MPGRALKLELALGCCLVLTQVSACRAQRALPKESSPTAAAPTPAIPTPVLPTAANSGASTAPSASACSSAWPAPLALSGLKAAPPSVALVPLQAEPGLWLADETGVPLDAKPDVGWTQGPITLAEGGG